MQSLKSFWPLRATLPFTLTPDVALLGRFALMFGFLSVAVLWLLAPGPSSQRAVPVVANPGAVQARVNPATPPRAFRQQITEADEEATSEVPAATLASTSSESSVESDPAPGPAAPAVVAAAPAPVIAQQLPVSPPPAPVPAEAEPQLVSVAASGQTKLAVIRLGTQVQTVTAGEQIGSWLVRQIRTDQVVVQRGNRTRVLAFGRAGTSSPTPAVPYQPNNYSSAAPALPTAPAVQPTPPTFDQGRPPQPQAAPAPPDVPEANQDSEENPNQQPNQPDER